jgi:hypothetical protein
LVLRNHSCLFARGLFTPADVMSVTPPSTPPSGHFVQETNLLARFSKGRGPWDIYILSSPILFRL